jgi:tetratricopeptide (TPR) repeat protein
MANKKSKPQKITFNPITYLKTGNARKLPVYECLLPKDWEEIKKFPVIFSRKHVNGNVTFTSVLVDLLCTGAKDVLFFVNEPESLYREILKNYKVGLSLDFEPVSYELIHNVIFESVAFAEEYGIAPHEDFRYSEMILEDDPDEFPRIEVPLGEGGKAHLYLNFDDERAPYFERQILKYGKVGTYEIIRNDFDPFLDEDEFDDEEEWDDYDEDDKYSESCFSWDELDWEDFYEEMNFQELTNDIVIYTLSQLPDYTYEEMIEEPIFAPFLEILHTEEPTTKISFSKKEQKYMAEVYERLEFSDLEFDEGDPELLEMIESGIKQYPKNRILYQYKWEYFQRSGDLPKSLEIALEMKEKFPDYLFGLTCHAQSLIEMGEVDSIPEAMNDFTKIQDFLPDREKFHITELQSFYSPWIYYYAKTGQLRAASFLFNFLEDHFVLISFPLHELVENALAAEAMKVVEPFYKKVKAGKVSKEEFVDMMMGED